MSTGSDRPENITAALVDAASALSGNTTEFFASRPTREPAPEAAFGFSSSALAGAEVHVVEARFHEALGDLYEAVVELCTPDAAVDFEALLGARCAIDIARGPRTRRLCGVARRVERLDTWGSFRRARAVLVPAMWALTRRVDSRIYQNLDAIEVVKAVLSDAGLDAPTQETRREYPKREYCVQYRETDFAFIARLLEEEGVVLYFRHDGEAETAVLADSPSYALCPTLDRRAVPFAPPQSEKAPVEVVSRLDLARELRSTGFTGRDYDFTRPLATLDMTRAHPRGDQGERARYEYPARFTPGPYDEGSHTYGAHDGGRRVEVRQGEEQAAERVAEGVGNVTGFMPGRVFQLVGHEHADLDQRYLLTHVTHHLRAPEELLTEADPSRRAEGVDRYRNEFRCVPASVAYVPPRRTPRPMVLAAQTAVVTGDGEEEIHVDAHGRIKVQFHWDRKGQHDGHSSCWVRVQQNWAGAGWGFMFIPRVGMEVVVTFLEGDPDRPLVTGCVYNGVNHPPYELPEKRTVSTIKSVSSPGGHGFNELRFEDQTGAEEIFLHAQRDLNEIVNHDHTLTVWNDQHIVIKGHQYVTVQGQGPKPSGMAGPGHGVKVTGDYNIDASGNVGIEAKERITGNAKGDIRLKSEASAFLTGTYNVILDSKFVGVTGTDWVGISSDTKILISVGGSSIAITPGGIDLTTDGALTLNGQTLKMSGTASAGLTSSGATDVMGNPVQLNGPGPFAGRVTELAPDQIITGAALVLVGGAAFPYPVHKEKDGSIKVGDHITIQPGKGRYKDFQAKVLRDLGVMSQTPNGKQRLDNIQNNPNGHNLTIREYTAEEANNPIYGPDNSLTYPGAGKGDDNALGYDKDGNPVPGKGADTTISYNPDINLGPDGHREPSDATLYHEMGHAEHNVYGTNRQWEKGDAWQNQNEWGTKKKKGGWENAEEWQTIEGGQNKPGAQTPIPGVPQDGPENDYLRDRGYPYRRTDHGAGWANQDGTPIKPGTH